MAHETEAGRAGDRRGRRLDDLVDVRADGLERANTPAQWYCGLVGLTLLLTGIAGFFVDSSFTIENGVDGGSLLGFEVNGWHNLVHLASGALLVPAAARRRSAKITALTFGILYGGTAVIGLLDGDDVLYAIAINDADNILHIALSGIGILAAVASPVWEHPRGEPHSGDPFHLPHDDAGRESPDHPEVDPLTGLVWNDDVVTRRVDPTQRQGRWERDRDRVSSSS